MKRIVAGLVVMGLVTALVVAPKPAEAAWHYSHGHGHGHGSGPAFVGGLAVGAVTGVILGGVLAPRVVYPAAPPVVYEPAPVYVAPTPVYVAPPPPVCQDYWVPQQYRGSVWVQGHFERACQ